MGKATESPDFLFWLVESIILNQYSIIILIIPVVKASK